MTIGQNIKKLRKNADMTQEELAEMLSISSQAVSRWETDSAMPDISLLPSLCSIFNVSSDELLGIDIAKQEEEINEIREKANVKFSRGYSKEARKILEDGLRKFPKSYLLMYDLMYIASEQSDDHEYSSEQRKGFKEESIQLGEKILASCTQDEIRNGAIQVLCFSYSDMGQVEKAQTLARKMPHMVFCQQSLMSKISIGDEKLRAKQAELNLCLHFLETGICYMDTKMDNGEWRYGEEENSILRDKSIAILDIIFEDGNYGFYHGLLTDLHTYQAKHHSKLQSVDKTLHHLKKASEHAIAFLNWNQDGEYTCLLFKGMKRGSFSTNDTRNNALFLLETMKSKEFEILFDNEEFINIKNQLEPWAKHW
ncbi:MAG: helix-turn-helix transcriptional regulator [Clostridia bacterium]|nr:helix-turn-helix transcriptional regulator [Clostridia bacterium]